MSSDSHVRWSALAVAMAAVMLVASCSGSSTKSAGSDDRVKNQQVVALEVTPDSSTTPPSGPELGRPVPSGRAATVTTSIGGAYVYSQAQNATTVWMPGDLVDGNIREVFWPEDAPFIVDQQVCVTWNDVAERADSPYPQPGIALRIAPVRSPVPGEPDGVRLISVNQNVYRSVITSVWVNLWDSTSGNLPFPAAGFDFRDVVGLDEQTVTDTWKVCARVRGRHVDVKVWIGPEEPGWHDLDHVVTVTLPADWTYAGYPGAYIGHLRPGSAATFTDLTITAL